MVNINYRDGRPIFEQIKDGFRNLILSGALPVDSRMPSVRELAVSLTINPNTIQRAYRELEADGYIYTVPGKGSFVCSKNDAAKARAADLTEEFRKIAKELFVLGVQSDTLIKILKEEFDR